MSASKDLTRWNRSGLARFRYVDGNAATYLERLREALASRFGEKRWKGLQRPGIPNDEPAARRRDRLVAQYESSRGDWGWEIGRALARACHILTEHLDAYANEGYLGTATQWDNVRKLVGMLDYKPAPPASASTPLVILAKGNPGPVEAGFRVRYAPPEGGEPLVFETLDDLEVDKALNAVRAAGWNLSRETLDLVEPVSDSPVARMPCIVIQGVGEERARLLNEHKSAISGGEEHVFTVGDFLELDPAALPVGLPRIRLLEYISKARELLSFSWSATALAAIIDRLLPSVAETPVSALAEQAGRREEEMTELLRDLRRVQIVLDEPVFSSLLLRDLMGTASPDRSSPWVAPENSGISAGQPGIVVREFINPISGLRVSEAAVVLVKNVDSRDQAVTIEPAKSQPDWRGWTKAETRLLAKPRFVERPRLHGPDVIQFETSHDLTVGQVIGWRNVASEWKFARVTEADEHAVRLSGTDSPQYQAQVFRGLEVQRGASGLLFPDTAAAAGYDSGAAFTLLTQEDYDVMEGETGEPTPAAKYRRLKSEHDEVSSIVYIPQAAKPAGRAAAQALGQYVFDGKPGKLAGGQWVVVDDGTRYWGLCIARITTAEDHYVVDFGVATHSPPPIGERNVEVVQGVGPKYATTLGDLHVNTVGELAALDVADLGAGVSTVRLWEFKTKAQTLMELSGGPAALSPLADQTLLEILETPDEELAEAAKGERTAAELKEQLRWVRACLDESAFAAIRLQELLPEPGQAVSDGPEQVLRLFGLFEHELRPAGYDYNGTPLFGSVIPVELADLPRFLTRGRTLVLEQESSDGAAGPALETRVTGVEPELPAVYVDPPIAPEDGYSMGNTIVRANVVRAGHGEGRPEKVLGSGDGTLSGQSFVLKEEGVSFVADPTQPAGVRADVEIRVEGPIWRQVASLAYSKATDPDYAVSMTEDGHLKFLFGDGARGRRLPTGANNVRVRFRVGNGLSGNIPVGSLVNPVSPHPRVEGVRQPLPAVGGNAMEPLRSLRENAPASLLTLDRAVSLADFGFLAARHASVWQACAFAVPTALNRHETIEVVVVPAEGGPLGDLGNTLTSFLRSHAPPGVQIQAVTRAQMVAFDLDVTARIKSAEYEPQKILGLLRDALLESFSLPNRKLGQDLFLSEIYRVVEEVPGVENSHCVLDGNAGLRRREATPRIVYYLDPGASILALAYEEYSL